MSIFAPEKLLVVGILALLVLGPNRLPAAARSAGRVIAQLRRMSGSFQSEVRDALAEPRRVLQHAVDEFGLGDIRSVRDTFNPLSFNPLAPSTASAVPPPPADPARVVPARTVPEAGQAPVPDDPSLN